MGGRDPYNKSRVRQAGNAVCTTKEEKRKLRFEWRNIKLRDHVKNLRLQGSIILKEILNGMK
jgi:hypothetical protein